MPTKSSNQKRKTSTPWCDATADVDSLEPNERVAHELVVLRRDLTPSVERIMNHEMSEAARGRALSVFADSLNNPGDPNRDPRVAIANATSEKQ